MRTDGMAHTFPAFVSESPSGVYYYNNYRSYYYYYFLRLTPGISSADFLKLSEV